MHQVPISMICNVWCKCYLERAVKQDMIKAVFLVRHQIGVECTVGIDSDGSNHAIVTIITL